MVVQAAISKHKERLQWDPIAYVYLLWRYADGNAVRSVSTHNRVIKCGWLFSDEDNLPIRIDIIAPQRLYCINIYSLSSVFVLFALSLSPSSCMHRSVLLCISTSSCVSFKQPTMTIADRMRLRFSVSFFILFLFFSLLSFVVVDFFLRRLWNFGLLECAIFVCTRFLLAFSFWLLLLARCLLASHILRHTANVYASASIDIHVTLFRSSNSGGER